MLEQADQEFEVTNATANVISSALGNRMTRIYLVKNRVDCASGMGHWGDYAYILWEGFSPEDDEGQTFIERTGPFVPEIYIASSTLICTSSAKSFLESESSNFCFSEAKKSKIVEVKWTEWDKDQEIDRFLNLDDIYDPIDIIENGAHNPDLAASMPDLWRVNTVGTSRVKLEQLRKFDPASPYSHLAFSQTPSPSTFLLAEGDGYLGWFTSESGREVLSAQFDDYLNFVEIPHI